MHMANDLFIRDSISLKNILLTEAGKISDEIDKLERSSDSYAAYYGYLKDFLINSGCLCDDILRASTNDAVLLAMIGARVILEDAINIHYVESKTDEAARIALAEEWLRLSNDPFAQKNGLDGKSVAARAKMVNKDTEELYKNEYAMFCNYTHSSAQRAILNIPEHRTLGAQKTILASLQAYANIVTCVARIVGQEKPKELDMADIYFNTYRETVTAASLPLDEKKQV
jgi:hypothetical protein